MLAGEYNETIFLALKQSSEVLKQKQHYSHFVTPDCRMIRRENSLLVAVNAVS